MSRIRTIKPSFFRSEDVSALPMRARLTWIGLWTQCDDQGRTKDNLKLIKADVWPLDQVTLAEIEEDLCTLADHGRIVRYEVDGRRFLAIVNWDDHQSINRPSASKIPPPTLNGHARLTENAVTTHDGKGREGKGREGNARAGASVNPAEPEPEPPNRCEKHLNSRNPPNCGGCADARKSHDEWLTARNTAVRLAAKCRLHRGELAHNCRICAAEELSPA